MPSKKDCFSEKLDLESLFLLIKPDHKIYYDNINQENDLWRNRKINNSRPERS